MSFSGNLRCHNSSHLPTTVGPLSSNSLLDCLTGSGEFLKDIGSKRVGVQQGATNERIIRERDPQGRLIVFPDQPAAFTVFEAAYIGEIVRAGVQSVPRAQVDAARAAGLSHAQVTVHIILPQAIRNMLPSLVTQFIVCSRTRRWPR